jgi:hypothetical protein
MYLMLAFICFVDIIGVGGGSWEVSIISGSLSKTWIIASDFIELVASIYNLIFLYEWSKPYYARKIDDQEDTKRIDQTGTRDEESS